jgi:hypothetical protein
VLLGSELVLPVSERAVVSKFTRPKGHPILAEFGLVFHLIVLDELLSFLLVRELSLLLLEASPWHLFFWCVFLVRR